MALYFEGTSTKDRYEVGKHYTTSHGVVQAQADGSFRDVSSGAVSRGSYGNPNVGWYATGADQVATPAFYTDQGRAIYANHAYAPSNAVANTLGGGGRQGGGAGGGQSEDGFAPGAALRVSAPITAGNRGAFIRDWAFSGKDDPIQDAVIAGRHWAGNPMYSNLSWIEERYGDSELITEIASLALLGSDIGFNAARAVWGDNVQNMSPAQRGDVLVKRAAASAEDVGNSVFEIGFGVVEAARNWAAENKANEERQARAVQTVNDAWDYREHLQAIEGQKAGDFSVLPKTVW